MKLLAVKFSIIAFSLVLTGCAGTNFVRITDNALVLGQTTSAQISSRLGPPYQQGVMTKNNHQLQTSNYAYSSAGGTAAAPGVTPARSQGFYFLDNKLVGYEFTSSWREDSTNFDSSKISLIKKGESTREDVMRLLGSPGGKYIYPVIPNEDESAINYLYNQTKGSAFNLKFYQKLLIVTFNKNDIVTNVEFTESGDQQQPQQTKENIACSATDNSGIDKYLIDAANRKAALENKHPVCIYLNNKGEFLIMGHIRTNGGEPSFIDGDMLINVGDNDVIVLGTTFKKAEYGIVNNGKIEKRSGLILPNK